MYSPGGWLKGFLAGVRGEERREKRRGVGGGSGEEWSLLPHMSGQERVEWRSSSCWSIEIPSFYALCVSLSLSPFPCLLFPPPSDSPIRDNVSGIDTARSGYDDRNTFLLCEADFHVQTLWSTKQPSSSTYCLTRLIVCYILSLLANHCEIYHWVSTIHFKSNSTSYSSISLVKLMIRRFKVYTNCCTM